MTTRRSFLSYAVSAATMAAVPGALRAQEGPAEDRALASRLAADPMRPQFHLLPAKNWMNDPNGPIFLREGNSDKGTYHMFFQYNPLAAVWGDMSWNHAMSTDMLHWTHLPLALTPTPSSADAYGVFSGSSLAVEMPGKKTQRVYAVYTGTRESTPELATIRDGENRIQESQCIAWSDDPQLVRWTKAAQPIIPLPPAGMKITGFRDPSAWRAGAWYYMTVGSGVAGVGGCVLLYRAKAGADLSAAASWEYLHVLTSGAWNGKKTANPCDDGEMWECPEFFAVGDPANGGGHVLIYSTLGKVWWQSGVLDEATMTFAPKQTGLLDLDAFYAPKTQLDARGRRILWGWIPERRPGTAMKAAGWSGMMSLPRVMSLDADGTLRLTVLPETSALRANKLLQEETRAGVRRTLPKATGEVRCVGDAANDFTFSMTGGGVDLLEVSYSAARHAFTADGRDVPLKTGDLPTLHAFVDGSVIELILGERIGYTKRFYYTSATAPDIVVDAQGAATVTMEAWTIAPISKNRLTTPASSV